MDRLTELEAFTAVVDRGGFTGAAKSLGLSKSAVSKHVSSLEARLGVQLLTRTTRRVNPTEVGLLYYGRARNVLTIANEADALVSQLQEAPAGNLRLSVTTDLGAGWMTTAVMDFLKDYPEMSVEVEIGDGPVDVGEDAFDVVLRMGESPDPALRVAQLADVPHYIVAAPSYLSGRDAPERIEDLADHHLLRQGHDDRHAVWQLLTETGEVRPVRARGRMTLNDAGALARTAIQGGGIAFLPSYLVGPALRDGRLVQVLPGLMQQHRTLYLGSAKTEFAQPRVQALLTFLMERCAHLDGSTMEPTEDDRPAHLSCA